MELITFKQIEENLLKYEQWLRNRIIPSIKLEGINKMAKKYRIGNETLYKIKHYDDVPLETLMRAYRNIFKNSIDGKNG